MRIGGLDAGGMSFDPPRMTSGTNQCSPSHGVSKSVRLSMIACGVAISCSFAVARGAETKTNPAWRSLPLITDGWVDDPGDIVWFKEVSVRPLPDSGTK